MNKIVSPVNTPTSHALLYSTKDLLLSLHAIDVAMGTLIGKSQSGML